MTDKQIIIDGVDVSGCGCFIASMDFPNNLEGGYYNQNNLCECGIQGIESYQFFCKDNPNCYYKQLKTKEQECEAYKMEAEEGREINAELKAELEAERNWHKTSDKISKVNSEYTVKLKQTLTEIKNIADEMLQTKIPFCTIHEKIIEKINEVEDVSSES